MKHYKVPLIIIIILAGIIGSLGIHWGVPDQDHIFAYNMDEMQYLIWLKNMNPSQFDFDPKVYSKTHLPFYYTAAVLKAGEVFGMYEIGSKEHYKQHPEEFKKIILLLRIFFGKIPSLLLIITSFFIGTLLVDDTFGVVLAGVSGFLPTILLNNNYGVENVLVTLLMAVAFYFSLKYYQIEKVKYIVLAGIFVGIAISTKQTGVLSFFFILGVLIAKWKQSGTGRLLKLLIFSGTACVIAFTLTSPYSIVFFILKVFFPSSILPDLHHGSTKMVIPMKFSLDFMIPNVYNILKINFIQLGGFLLLCVPLGIYFKRDNAAFRIIGLYIIIFLVISSSNVWATDARLMPMTYFMAVLGTAGMYCLCKACRSKLLKGLTVFILIFSLSAYVASIKFFHLEVDNRKSSSLWIKHNILDSNRSVTIGLNDTPYFNSPHIITKEWMHNRYPDSSYYPDRYNETLIIPDYELRKFGGKRILPEREILSSAEKMKWLESGSPEYVILSYSPKYGISGWPEYFERSQSYKLIKHFPKYDFLGVSRLDLYSYNIYIYKRIEDALMIKNENARS